MKKGMDSPRIKLTFNKDEHDTDLAWCDMRAELTLMLDREDIPALIVQMAQFLDSPSVEYLELDLMGRVYMTGRLPVEATWTPTGEPSPGIVITDDVHGWDFERDDFPDDDDLEIGE